MDFLTRYSVEQDGVLSNELWRDCPRGSILMDPNTGYYFRDDFMQLVTGKYTITQAGSAGTFALIDGAGGIAVVDCASSTATQGANVQANTTVGEHFLPAEGKTIWFEVRLAVADMAAATTGPEFFCGLSVIDTSIIASSANSSANHIGFESVTDNGVLLFHSESAGTRVSTTTPGGFATAAAGAYSYRNLGFKVTGTSLIEIYVDGVKFGETITASIPTTEMVFSIVNQSDGTVDPTIAIDNIEIFQLR
jgi:hypothetical protein